MKRIISITLILLIILSLFCPVALARAGGGGGGGGGGGAFFGRRYFHFSHFKNSIQGLPMPVQGFAIFLYYFAVLFSVVASIWIAVTIAISIKRAHIKSKILLKKLGKNDPVWDPKTLDKYVCRSFFIIQNAWSEQKLHVIKPLLSESLYKEFEQTLEQNKRDHTKNVLSKIKLKKAFPVSVQDRIGDDNDYIWYHIYASMVDLTYDTDTNRLLSETKKPTSFVEYWRFKKQGDKWVLDRICQQGEFEKFILKSETPQ